MTSERVAPHPFHRFEICLARISTKLHSCQINRSCKACSVISVSAKFQLQTLCCLLEILKCVGAELLRILDPKIVCYAAYYLCWFQTPKRFSRMLFFFFFFFLGQNTTCNFFWLSPLSTYKTTFKQQLNGEKWWKIRWRAKPFICFWLSMRVPVLLTIKIP